MAARITSARVIAGPAADDGPQTIGRGAQSGQPAPGGHGAQGPAGARASGSTQSSKRRRRRRRPRLHGQPLQVCVIFSVFFFLPGFLHNRGPSNCGTISFLPGGCSIEASPVSRDWIRCLSFIK